VVDRWTLGRREVGDGVLLVVAKSDRQMSIDVAKALKGAVPDLSAQQIIDRAVGPAFRVEHCAGGLSARVDGLIASIKGEGLSSDPARDPCSSSTDGRAEYGHHRHCAAKQHKAPEHRCRSQEGGQRQADQ